MSAGDTLDKLVVFLAKRDGIDKLVKTFQYVSKLAHWGAESSRPEVARRAKSWETASMGRRWPAAATGRRWPATAAAGGRRDEVAGGRPRARVARRMG